MRISWRFWSGGFKGLQGVFSPLNPPKKRRNGTKSGTSHTPSFGVLPTEHIYLLTVVKNPAPADNLVTTFAKH